MLHIHSVSNSFFLRYQLSNKLNICVDNPVSLQTHTVNNEWLVSLMFTHLCPSVRCSDSSGDNGDLATSLPVQDQVMLTKHYTI